MYGGGYIYAVNYEINSLVLPEDKWGGKKVNGREMRQNFQIKKK